MKKILLPTDFSDNALKAAQYAAEIATRNGSFVYLLHVIEPLTDSIRQPYPLHERLQEEIVNNRLKELDFFMKSIAQKYPRIRIEPALVKGTTATSVLDFAERNQVDLIVMGTKGATGMKEIFMGSVTAGTIARTKVPVLAVPGKYVFEVPDGILLATNHFEEDKDLLHKIVELAEIFSATIHVAVFLDTDTAQAVDYIYDSRQLDHHLGFLKKNFPGIAFKGELLEGSEFEETLEKYNVKSEVDIIVMITYPKSFWQRLINRSATKKLTFHSKIPVLAIPAK